MDSYSKKNYIIKVPNKNSHKEIYVQDNILKNLPICFYFLLIYLCL